MFDFLVIVIAFLLMCLYFVFSWYRMIVSQLKERIGMMEVIDKEKDVLLDIYRKSYDEMIHELLPRIDEIDKELKNLR